MDYDKDQNYTGLEDPGPLDTIMLSADLNEDKDIQAREDHKMLEAQLYGFGSLRLRKKNKKTKDD